MRTVVAFTPSDLISNGIGMTSPRMDETNMPELDWIHLPSDCDALSLWDCLHDGELLSCRSDLVNRTVCLEFDIMHLREESDNAKFLIHFEGVTSVRANIVVRWPGEFKVPSGVSREQESLLIAEYQAKWREQSLGWSEFEDSLATGSLSVTEATIARNDETAAIKLSGFLDGDQFDDQYCTVFIICGSISATRSDGQPFSLLQLLALGHDYWEAFAARRIAGETGG